MAAFGRLAARSRHAGQLRKIMGAANAWEGTSHMVCPLSCRHKPSEDSFRAGHATGQTRSFFNLFGSASGSGRAQEPNRPRPQPTGPARRNDYGVDHLDRDDEWEDELRARRGPSKKDELVSSVANDVKPATDSGQLAKTTESAVDKAGNVAGNVATSALDNVGNVLTKTALTVELDVSLQELSIEKLVLKDLGLVLVIKTKPQPAPGTLPPPEEPDTRERKAMGVKVPRTPSTQIPPTPTQQEEATPT